MSPPTRPLVTIDDRVTIIEPHRVLLEYVEVVKREGFHVQSEQPNTDAYKGPAFYRHEDEGTTWARGHHVPDSEVVDALYAAVRLAPPKPESKPSAEGRISTVTSGPRAMEDLLRVARAEMEAAQKTAEKNTPKWWRSRAHR